MSRGNKKMTTKASSIFLFLAKYGAIPHGQEEYMYGNLLKGEGFQALPGGYYMHPEREIILSAHLDTVKGKGKNTFPVTVKVKGGIARGDAMMGCDDKAGIAAILSLARTWDHPRVGYALFFGEEVGCVGADEAIEKKVLPNAKAVISLDRKGTTEVIYVQGRQTASIDAAKFLADSLGLSPSPNGLWTDSAAFADIVPECLNLAVGYQGHHSENDEQDLDFLDRLTENLKKVEWDQMPIVRDPKAVEYGYRYASFGYGYIGKAGNWNYPMTTKECLTRLKIYGLESDALAYILNQYPELVDEIADAFYLRWEEF
jgi:hypothetical protein